MRLCIFSRRFHHSTESDRRRGLETDRIIRKTLSLYHPVHFVSMCDPFFEFSDLKISDAKDDQTIQAGCVPRDHPSPSGAIFSRKYVGLRLGIDQ